MPLYQQQLKEFHRDGYIIVPNLFDGDTMDAARSQFPTGNDALDSLFENEE